MAVQTLAKVYTPVPSPFSLHVLYTPRMKKVLGIFALMAAAVGALMFWRRRRDDDEFLDEELE